MTQQNPIADFQFERFAKSENLEGLLDELERFLVFWLGDGQSEYDIPEGEPNWNALPLALKRLYTFSARWPDTDERRTLGRLCLDAFGGETNLVSCKYLEFDEHDRLIFVEDNQGLGSLAIATDEKDPQVWVTSDGWNGKWHKGNPSLTKYIITFCLETLTLGAKTGYSDRYLTDILRTNTEIVTPLWIDKDTWTAGLRTSFYLINENVLVLDGGGENCYFAANSDAGVRWILENQAPITSLSLSTKTINDKHWSFSVSADGSGKLGAIFNGCGYSKNSWDFEQNTFEFESLFKALYAARTKYDDKCRSLTFFREGRGYASGEGIKDEKLVGDIFSEVFSKVDDRKDQFKNLRSEIEVSEI